MVEKWRGPMCKGPSATVGDGDGDAVDPIEVDQWIIGQGADSRISYLHHPGVPVFFCKFTSINEIYPGDTPVFGCGDWVFWDFYWQSDLPTEDEFRELVQAGVAAIERLES